ncbi:hypothetical protein NCU07606 [Neurospora crassa OR74A]|uniref:Uncharacterized protein n=1 Tax=Neurospora crassa (strain ATCC 24698 / 74-OR23-1A / CBS 708.71 / DSM 1257 / FGSC 987) TaxID=367110 RepID=Q7SBF0_NEUCR|nr:hypothetical protein NCU07606 [Neurospora crassa OR74A]EAA33750.3 hypothetical protein NCU07606 [Neurospora crassa OR74A]|eukprot:XP_962986.3 hypothetical protein NCU07606 [Neurospora crassa OR74A]
MARSKSYCQRPAYYGGGGRGPLVAGEEFGEVDEYGPARVSWADEGGHARPGNETPAGPTENDHLHSSGVIDADSVQDLARVEAEEAIAAPLWYSDKIPNASLTRSLERIHLGDSGRKWMATGWILLVLSMSHPG